MTPLGWAYLRWTLGIGQMAGALLSFTFLIRDGISARSLGCFATTSILTTISVMLFGSRAKGSREKTLG